MDPLKKFGIGFLAVLMVFSCRRKLDEVSWKTRLMAPLAKTSLSIRDIAQDDSSVIINDDQSVSLIFSELLYESQNPLDSLVDIEIEPFYDTVSLRTLQLAEQTISDTVFMGPLVDGSNGGATITDGAKLPAGVVLFLVNPINLDPINIDATDFFESAVIQEGTMYLTIDNQFGVDLSTVDIEISNFGDGAVILDRNYTDILDGETFRDSIDLPTLLGDQPIEGNLVFSLTNINIGTENDSITIDYENFIAMSMSLKNIFVREATAIFPAQNVVDANEPVPLIGMEDVELTYIEVERASVNIKVTHTVPTAMFLHYELPLATLNGEPFVFDADVDPAPPGGSVSYDRDYPFDGYSLDLTGENGDTVNQFNNILRVRIDSTGELIHLSLSDSMVVELTINEIVPSYAEGYFGQETTQEGPDTAAVDIFDFIQDGALEFESLSMNLRVQNGLGIPAQIDVNQLTSLNSNNNNMVSMTPPPTNIQIAPATQVNRVVTPQTTTYSLEDGVQLLNNNPDKVIYDISLISNPEGNVPPHSNFITNQSGLEAFLDVEVPMTLKANNLTLQDTVDLDFTGVTRPTEIGDGILKLVVENDFPLDAQLTLTFLDEEDNVTLKLTSGEKINGSSPPGQQANAPSAINYALNAAQTDELLQAQKVVLQVTFNSIPTDEFVTLFDSYLMDISLVADFNYQVKSER